MFFRFVPVGIRARFALAAAGLCFTAPAHAGLQTGYSAGSGASTSLLVIDFAFVGGDAYLFEYHYDGSATAEQMLLELDSAGALSVHHQYFDFGTGPTIFVNGLSYLGHSEVPGFEGASGENWSYWVNDDPQSNPAGWAESYVGPTDRVLTDGSLDGWALNVSPFNSQEIAPTSTPPAIVPEPMSITLLALGGLALVCRRR